MLKIIAEHLKYKYPMTDKLALDDISFEISEGEFIGIIGRSQSGKSTLCQALPGLVPHFFKGSYGGKVNVCGLEVLKTPISKLALKVGLVFQNPFTQVTGSKLTVYEEIAFGLENLGLKREEMIDRVDRVLEILNISRFKDRNPFELSGGQMQRMAIAGVMAMSPDVIVLDEPTSQLDPQGSEEVFQAVSDLNRNGITVIMVEHKMEKIAEYCNRVMVLDSGRLVDFDSPTVIFSKKREGLNIPRPVYTEVCRELNAPLNGSGLFPVTLAEACSALGGKIPGAASDPEAVSEVLPEVVSEIFPEVFPEVRADD